MIGVYHRKFNDIPALVVVDSEKEKEALPVVAYSHGFTSAKEHNLPLAYLLAEKGYRVVLPDSKYHGEREVDISAIKKQISFWDIVMLNVHELKEIKDILDQEGLVLDERFGLAGTSMGGITTSAALTQYPWIKAAAVLMGSPKITTYAKTLVDSFRKLGDLPVTEEMIDQLFEDLKKYDLSRQADKLSNRPLLFWHGENDSVVPFDHSYTFYDQAKQLYNNQDNIKFLKESNRDHKVSRYAILETVRWFDTHL
ncbi:prolyl oligopeptidase family serine peptidase [Virgibacillus oceani]|uniref:Esterase YitV n=1 Tax=Virgibacillus oceani TaxID=1479511 RepID=A0A917HDG0_9BACI|nr:prolyl oligopeptidase family serine peptidase [Virgibacillus oceani]GGG75410.1 putative esterase YitV [Virgibacillus oceani]